MIKRMSGLGISASAGPHFLFLKGGEEEEEKEEATDGSSGNERGKVPPTRRRAAGLRGTSEEITPHATAAVTSEPSGPGLPTFADNPAGRPSTLPPTPTSLPASTETRSDHRQDSVSSPRTAVLHEEDAPASPNQRARFSPTALLPRSPHSFFSPHRRPTRQPTSPSYTPNTLPYTLPPRTLEGQLTSATGTPEGIPPAYYALLRAGKPSSRTPLSMSISF